MITTYAPLVTQGGAPGVIPYYTVEKHIMASAWFEATYRFVRLEHVLGTYGLAVYARRG